MKVYGIGGLGVDERVFTELTLNFEITPIQWIKPISNESIEDYAVRLSKQIDTETPFSIIGVSFGGMIAIELNKILSPDKIVLISSATSKSDIPPLFRLFGKIGLIKLIPNFLMKPPSLLTNFFFGVTELRFKKVLKQIIADTDLDFLRWATNQIAKWNNTDRPSNLVRIHGSDDRLSGFQKEENLTILQYAGHFMVMDRAKEVSEFLNKHIH